MYAVTHLAFFECVSTNDRYNNPGNEMDNGDCILNTYKAETTQRNVKQPRIRWNMNMMICQKTARIYWFRTLKSTTSCLIHKEGKPQFGTSKTFELHVMIADYFWTNHHCHHTGLYNSGSMSCGPGRHLESAMLDNTSNHSGMVQLDRYTLRYDLHFQVWRHWKWISMVLPSASNFEQLSEFNEIKDIKGSYLPRLNSLLLQQFAAEHAT